MADLSTAAPGVIAKRLADAARDTRIRIAPRDVAVLAHHMATNPVKAERAGLSPRLADVLYGLAAGETVGQTAARIGLTADTVKTHRERLYRKLGALNGPHAVAIAGHMGLLPQGGGPR